MEMEFEVRGLEEALRLYDPRRVMEALGKALLAGALALEGPIKEATPVDTGRLRASIRSGLLDQERSRVYTDVEYAPYVEMGTRPHWPPVSALEGWARRHGIEPFLVARAIAERGTKGAQMFQRAAQEHGQEALELIARALREALEGK
jgi:hypothetical protein